MDLQARLANASNEYNVWALENQIGAQGNQSANLFNQQNTLQNNAANNAAQATFMQQILSQIG